MMLRSSVALCLACLLASFPARPGTFAVDTFAIYGAVTGTSGFVYAVAKPP